MQNEIKMTDILQKVIPNLAIWRKYTQGLKWSQYICDNVATVAEELYGKYSTEYCNVIDAWEKLALRFGLSTHCLDQFTELQKPSPQSWRNFTKESQFARALTCTFMLEFLKDNPEYDKI